MICGWISIRTLNTPNQIQRQTARAALRERIEEGALSVRSLITQHVLRETFGLDELAIQTQLESLQFLGETVYDGADVRIVPPGADSRQFINCGDPVIIEREQKPNLYVQGTPLGDLVLAKEGDPVYTTAVETFEHLWEDDRTLKTPDAVLAEIVAATREVGVMPGYSRPLRWW